ncbi:MAG: Flp family type IVb pilin [Stellaceae bacterium]
MQNVQTLCAWLADDERGVTALEYGLITGLIAVFILGAVTMLGQGMSSVFTTVANSM